VKAVFGPGTGLWVAGIIPLEGGGWHVVASEGGHMSFGPSNRDEDALFVTLRARHGPLSAETLLSGPGLERLYATLTPDEPPLASHEIVRRAQAADKVACACLEVFVRLLGRFAGDIALLFKAVGGVYVAGGVAVGIADCIDHALFRGAFEAHPPYAQLLATVPTFLVTCREPGLLGCAALAMHWLGEDYAI
jgi:glucokinase